MAAEPSFRVIQPHATDEEIAALAVVLAARLAAGPPAGHEIAGRGPAGRWAERARSMRAPLARGPEAWRRAGLPSG